MKLSDMYDQNHPHTFHKIVCFKTHFIDKQSQSLILSPKVKKTRTTCICVQYQRILFYSFYGKEDFSKVFHKIIYVQIVFGYYFADNVGGTTI